jgi:CDP-paratose 2-epimerase
MKYLVTGGCGFIGSNLSAEVLRRGEELVVFDNLFRAGSSDNLAWLKKRGKFTYYPWDIRNANDVETVIRTEKPDYVFHLAGQVAMTTSILNPRLDFEINALGTFNIIDSVRKYAPHAVILYSSSNKVYGDFADLHFDEMETRYVCREFPEGFNEQTPLDFQSPYGCSKGTADQYLRDANRIFGIKTVVFRHSSMYGVNQHATVDQGWVGWFCQKALEIRNAGGHGKIQISGNGKQVRDLLNEKDVVSLYFGAKDCSAAYGKAFNIGGGYENSLSLIELFVLFERMLGIRIDVNHLPWRESDQKVFIADNSSAQQTIDWNYEVDKETGIREMLTWLDNGR